MVAKSANAKTEVMEHVQRGTKNMMRIVRHNPLLQYVQ